MDFARLMEQAKDLWSRPLGKWLFGGALALVVLLASVSYIANRPTYVPLGTFEPADAAKVAQKLTEKKIVYQQTGSGYTFQVRQEDLNTAILVMAEINLDPASINWSPDLWNNRTDWSNTDFDKRRLWEEQTEINLTRAIKQLSVVEQARVDISVPMDKPLFKQDEKPPKASVFIQPKRGQELTIPVTESIMEAVAGAVEGLDPLAVVVIDTSKSRVVSGDAFKQKEEVQTAGQAVTDHFTILQRYQEHYQKQLTQQLEKVVGIGNASVIVTPRINWEKVIEEAKRYNGAGGNGKGIILSSQERTKNSEGSAPPTSGQDAAGTPSNSDLNVPSYPGATPGAAGNLSQEESESILNYLVDETKTVTERPGGAIEEISVGVFVNRSKVDAATEQAMRTVVTTAMGSKAKVDVAAITFAENPFDTGAPPTDPGPGGAATNWLVLLLVVALTLIGIVSFFLFFKPRKPVLEPVFAGPEAAMLGGIPVTDFEMATAADAYGRQRTAGETAGAEEAPEKRLPETPEELARMAPEEIALLGDDFLQQIGVDPAQVRMKEKVEKVAKGNPEAVALLLKTWISDK